MNWPLAEAKNKFSEVVDRALRDGPQFVTRHGKDCVVVLSQEAFEALEKDRPPRKAEGYKDFKDWLFNGPVDLSELDLTRDKSPMREVNFEED